MKKFLRYFGAVLFLILAAGCFGQFEYWKLLEEDSRYQYAAWAAGGFLMFSAFLFSPLKQYGWRRCLTGAVYVALFFAAAEFGYLKWRGGSDLNRELRAKGRCESVLVELLGDSFEGSLKNAQNACTMRLLQNQLTNSALGAGEEKIGTVTRLLASEDRLNETTLVLLLSDYSTLENSHNTEKAEDLDLIKNEFNFVEGAIPILEVYHVKPLFSGNVNGDAVSVEKMRMKKLLELSTLGKTLGVFVGRTQGAIQGYNQILKLQEHGLKIEAGEVTLLGLRVQRIKDGYNRVIRLWDLAGALEALNVKDTYPAPYEKVHQEVTYQPL